MRCFRSGHAVIGLLLAIPAFIAESAADAPRLSWGRDRRPRYLRYSHVPNAPFSATIDILSHEDSARRLRQHPHYHGSISHDRPRAASITSAAQLVPTKFKGEPQLLSAHIYDPSSRLSIFYNPFEHLARERNVPRPPVPLLLTQYRPLRHQTIPTSNKRTSAHCNLLTALPSKASARPTSSLANMSSTGKEIAIVDEYWYSPGSLHLHDHQTQRSTHRRTTRRRQQCRTPRARCLCLCDTRQLQDRGRESP